MAGLNQVAPSPSPYQNLTSDMNTQDSNADYLQQGVEDAKSRFKAASEQYNARPGMPEKAIYDQAYQDLMDRTNRAGAASGKAREIELQQKMSQPKAPTQNFTTPDGGPGIEFNKGLDLQAKPSAGRGPSSIDMSALLKMAGNAISPDAEGATLSGAVNPSVAQDPTTLGPYYGANKYPPQNSAPAATPVKQAPVTASDMAQKAATAIQTLRQAGVGQIGDKSNVTGTNKGGTTDTKSYLISPSDISDIGGAVRNTPEWQRQSSGLDALDNLVSLQAQRNAKKSSVDLSPLGAYLDYTNALRGQPTNLAAGLKAQPIEDESMKDMGDIQRRRADLSKELVNTIRASKVGTYSAQDAYNYAYSGGVQPPRPVNPMGAQRFGLAGVQDLKKATDSAYKDNDEQLKAINTISQRVNNSATNPAESGSLPALLEVMDTGSKRILAGVLGMEGYDPSVPGQLKAGFMKATQGMIPADQRAFLQDRLTKAAQRATDQRGAIQADLHNYAGSLPVSPSDVRNIVDSHHTMAAKAFPSAVQAGTGGSAATTAPAGANPQDEFNSFMQMMKAHDAGAK